MRINILTPVLRPGGGIRVIYEIANRLHSQHDVAIYHSMVHPEAWWGSGNLIKKVAKVVRSLPVRYGTDVEWMDVLPPVYQIPSFNPKLAPLLDQQIRDADVMIATSWPTAYTADSISSQKGTPHYFVQHYEIWPVWNEMSCWKQAQTADPPASIAMTEVKPRSEWMSQYKKAVDQSYQLGLRNIITSNWEAKVLNKLNAPYCGKVTYGINTGLFYPSHDSSDVTVLALYRNSPEKGDKQAIDSFKKLNTYNSEIEFKMFGRTQANCIPDFVDFHENPSQSKIRDLYSEADLFIYPSWVEGYGMPPMEAMACRTCVISTDVGAVRDYSPEGGISFIPIQDSESIVNEAKRLLDRPELIEEKKEICYEHIQQYTWNRTATEFESLLIP